MIVHAKHVGDQDGAARLPVWPRRTVHGHWDELHGLLQVSVHVHVHVHNNLLMSLSCGHPSGLKRWCWGVDLGEFKQFWGDYVF